MTQNTFPEEIQSSFGSSFTFKYSTNLPGSGLSYWHHHPEFVIFFVSNGKGNRLIGGHESNYNDGDLVLLGPNIPHLGFAQEIHEEHFKAVIQMKENFLGKDLFLQPEFTAIRNLFERARSGLTFGDHTKWIIGQHLAEMKESDDFYRMLKLLLILQILAYAKDYTSLNINDLSMEVKPQDQQRMKEVYSFVEQNFHRKFKQDEVAKHVNMSTPALCRFFKKQTHKTFSDFLNEFRVAHACRKLSEEHLSISAVSFESGFNNLSHFNKQFKLITGLTPSAFRQNQRKIVNAPMEEKVELS